MKDRPMRSFNNVWVVDVQVQHGGCAACQDLYLQHATRCHPTHCDAYPLDDNREDRIYELDMVNQDMHSQDIIPEHECNLHPLMTSHYKHPHAKNKKAVCIGLVDGARIRHGGAKTLSSSSSSTASFIDLTCPVNRL